MNRGNKWALLPFIVFILLFIGTGIITQDFSTMPLNVAVLLACIVAFFMNRREKLSKKLQVFTAGAGHPNVLLMVAIFILAGVFASVAKDMGAVTSTVNLGLSYLPSNYLLVGLFIIGCFISLSMGTSMGTVVALAPIGVGIADATTISLPLAMATVVGGAMFGDNLSVISDTTIAAVKTQGVNMKDKFRVNIKIVLPAAAVTALFLTYITWGTSARQGEYTFHLLEVLPYLIVLIAALIGIDVFIVLVGGTVLSAAVGFYNGSFTVTSLLQSIGAGIISMEDIAIIALLISGLVAIVQYNGGIDYLLAIISKRIQSRRGAELGIATLVSAADISTANNTISILLTGPIAKDIAEKYDVDARKSASLLDIFASVWQGLLPYSPQLLAAASVAGISTLSLLSYSFYPVIMAVFAFVAIIFRFPNLKK
ncbi:Na+/H+ antiporter NhaC family protein [Kurthia sibirica]|uniref:Sodium:proton antiporter n=1 Tax=Kurthia sibirica TaxID=202750 RepID=A0A2U3AJ33_9BACL|nr:Na+/H+ antiporter NhaC family protein [Kurthia sibirica]PWI24504.1 sodium:proton antiporter [Kurthia sibirica]GEK33568.1 sodium:proton antiporter [Kurthia sibirica]